MVWLAAPWIVYLAIFLVNHLRVRNLRRAAGAPETGARRAPLSMVGAGIEGVAVWISWMFAGPPRASVAWLAALLMTGSIIWTFYCLRHLGDQWRIKAVVTDDHRLITTGPYSIVRHPIYLGLFAMLAANLIAVTRWPAAIAALAIYLCGTELRVRVEDGLLSARFPEAAAYRSRVPAYLPGIR